jgi:hypothetical protein
LSHRLVGPELHGQVDVGGGADALHQEKKASLMLGMRTRLTRKPCGFRFCLSSSCSFVCFLVRPSFFVPAFLFVVGGGKRTKNRASVPHSRQRQQPRVRPIRATHLPLLLSRGDSRDELMELLAVLVEARLPPFSPRKLNTNPM